MLTEIYIEALLVDEELADQVWEAGNRGKIDDQVPWWAWAYLEKFTARGPLLYTMLAQRTISSVES